MDFVMQNWEYVAIGILVIDKVVAMSPSKMDDLIWACSCARRRCVVCVNIHDL